MAGHLRYGLHIVALTFSTKDGQQFRCSIARETLGHDDGAFGRIAPQAHIARIYFSAMRQGLTSGYLRVFSEILIFETAERRDQDLQSGPTPLDVLGNVLYY